MQIMEFDAGTRVRSGPPIRSETAHSTERERVQGQTTTTSGNFSRLFGFPSRATLNAGHAPLRARARMLAWACVGAIATLSLVPGSLRPQSFLPGLAEHFAAYAVAGFLVALGHVSLRQLLLNWIALTIATGAFELLQNFVPGRTPNALDVLSSFCGLTIGLAVGAIIDCSTGLNART